METVVDSCAGAAGICCNWREVGSVAVGAVDASDRVVVVVVRRLILTLRCLGRRWRCLSGR